MRVDSDSTPPRFAAFLAALLLAFLVPAAAEPHFAGGDGVEGIPYIIETAEQLAKLAEFVNHSDVDIRNAYADKHYVLAADIDLSGYDWVPIGNGGNVFRGVFDGDGKKISNLRIKSNIFSSGLFGGINGATVRNLGVENVKINIISTASSRVGGIVGSASNNSSIENSYVTGKISGDNTGIGQYGGNSVGGIAGSVASGSVIKNGYFIGTVINKVSSGGSTGGIAGSVSDNGLVENSYVIGTVTSNSRNGSTGGIAGNVGGAPGGGINNCYSLTTVNALSTASSIAGDYWGYSLGPTVKNNVALKIKASNKIEAESSAVEIINSMFSNGINPVVESIEFKAAIPGTENEASGIDGVYKFTLRLYKNGELWLESNELTLAVSAPYNFFAGGDGTPKNPYLITNAAQLAKLASLVNSETTNQIYANEHYQLVEDIDLSGYANWIPIGDNIWSFKGVFDGNGKKIANLKIIAGTSNQGLFGYTVYATIQNLGIENADISGNNNVGGIVADASASLIKNCYITGRVSGNSIVGGIAGYTTFATAVNNCYSTATVSGENNVGGIVGRLINAAEIGNSAALGITIMHTDATSFGRIAGAGLNAANYFGNIAYADMLVSNATISNDANGRDGLGKTSAEILDGTAFNDLFTDNIWVKEAGKLPGFGTAREMPEYLKSSDKIILIEAMERIKIAVRFATQAEVSDENTVEAKIETIIESLDLDEENISFTVESINFKPAVIGDETIPLGINGSYEFKVTLNQNGIEYSEELSIEIIATPSFNGEGTEASPYEIATAAQLAALAQLVNNLSFTNVIYANKYYKLTANIDLSGYSNWVPIGSRLQAFRGVFDGNAHKISNLTINRSRDDQGLFGYIVGGRIRNLAVENANIRGRWGIGSIAGGGVGGVIENCWVTATVSGTTDASGTGAGGIASSGTIVQNCVALGPEIRALSISGRIGGSGSTNNRAYSNMIVNGSLVSTGTLTNQHGLNITAAEIFEDGTIGGLFDADIWTTENGKLPGFGKAVDMPDYLLADALLSLGIMDAINAASYATIQAKINNENDAKIEIQRLVKKIINADISITINGVDALVDAQAGTATGASTELGTNGSYKFTISVAGLESNELTLNIIATPHSSFADGGGGISEYPYQISAATQLTTLANRVSTTTTNAIYANKHYMLMQDITLSGTSNWNPIGTNFDSFSGTFDGGGNKIIGLRITSGSNRGLFGRINNGGVVKNLGLENVNIAGDVAVGGIAGNIRNNSIIENCYVTGSISSSNINVGGIVGDNGGTVRNSWSSVTVSGTNNVGGIAGLMSSNSRIENSVALGYEIRSAELFGRIAGNDNVGIFSGNAAYEEMKTPVPVTDGDASNKNGEDKTFVSLLTASGFPATLRQEPWFYETGKFPGFGKGVDLPPHFQTFLVELTIKKDDELWEEHGRILTLKLKDAEDIFDEIDSDDPQQTFRIAQGTWRIYDNGIDTEIEINAFTRELTLDYYTVNFSVELEGYATSGSTIKATYNGVDIENGAVVLGGKELILTAIGKGATEFEYKWHNNEETAQIEFILENKIFATCTITGKGVQILIGIVTLSNTTPRIGDMLSYSLDVNYNNSALIPVWKWEDGTQLDVSVDIYEITSNDLDKKIVLEIRPDPNDQDIQGMISATTEPVGKRIPTIADLDYTIPTNHIYNGSQQGVVVTKKNDDIGEISVYYDEIPEEPINAGTYKVTVEILESDYYEAREIELGTYTINKAEGGFETQTLNTTYAPALTLGDLKLPPGYEWSGIGILDAPLAAGNDQQFPAAYTCPSGNYEPANGTITVNVAKATGSFIAHDAINTTYTPTLTLGNLNLLPGYEWSAGISHTPLEAGNGQSFEATYTCPSGNYEPANGTITVNVAKATPANVVFPTANPITYNLSTTLLQISFIGGEGDGNFAWENNSIVPVVNNNGYKVVFTPRDANNYDYEGIEFTATVDLSVSKATPAIITFPTANFITYDLTATLSQVALEGGIGDGTFAWEEE
ncbi:MAG: MBG domain-containing protein, partial [Fibromonadaceae bacterium]|nr:MBG domain-containing protein [Fibromonadaceae bacterium]